MHPTQVKLEVKHVDQLSEKSGLRVDTIVMQIAKCASLLYDIDFSQALM